MEEEGLKEILELLNEPTAENTALIKRAYDFAKKAHDGQKRNSGEPYFNHVVATAKSLAELHQDASAIAAGLLHDVVEDTPIPAEEIEKNFGTDIRFIVEGVTKLGSYRYHGADKHNESLRKLLLATTEDMRVLFVKLCDRLHNMRTLKFVPQEKRVRIARETLEIYAPIAYRLGIRKLSRELEDLSFPYVYPEGYEELTSLLKTGQEKRVSELEEFNKAVAKELAKNNFNDFKIDYRVKGFYSLYKKYLKSKKNLDNIYDILAMRITVDKTEDCYKVLGLIHSAWRPLPGKIKDYISFPKLNGYQSLHTTVFTNDGGVVEIQIRTSEMHKKAEYGVASHALYKAEGEKAQAKKEVSRWVKSLTEDDGDIKTDFLSERIFVFTPHGDVVDLPHGASAIDFAYAIHSDVGDHMSGAKINGKLCALTTLLKGGEIVEVVISKNAKPNRKWLESAKTSLARKHIRTHTPN
jgi:GTP diphosphokinase / guanosine-3',5'-bis(diphosphate) 3'-diphosphatase